jgi:hypothetical protein
MLNVAKHPRNFSQPAPLQALIESFGGISPHAERGFFASLRMTQ